MGGNNYRQKKSSSSPSSSAFSVFNIFKFGKARRTGDHESYYNINGHMDDARMSSGRKVRPIDTDEKGPWLAVADPQIDTKASAFIANFYAARVSESNVKSFRLDNPLEPQIS